MDERAVYNSEREISGCSVITLSDITLALLCMRCMSDETKASKWWMKGDKILTAKHKQSDFTGLRTFDNVTEQAGTPQTINRIYADIIIHSATEGRKFGGTLVHLYCKLMNFGGLTLKW